MDKGTPVLVKGKFRVNAAKNNDGKKITYFEVIASRILTDNLKTGSDEDTMENELASSDVEFSDLEAELADMENPLFE